MARASQIQLDVWSDYVCPFCYLELPVLDRLRDELGEALEIRWRAFELRPDPVPTLDPDGEYLHTVWNRSVYPMAAERGMTLRLPPVQPRSRRALEAAEHAREEGRFDEVHRALFRAFFEDGRDLGELDVLLDVGRQAGLDPDGLREALEDGRHTDRVVADQALAHRLGLTGVPALLIRRSGEPIERARAASGALPYRQLRAAVDGVREVADQRSLLKRA